MKRLVLFFSFFLFLIPMWGQDVKFSIVSGEIEDSLKQRIEKNVSELLSVFNNSAEGGSLDLSSVAIDSYEIPNIQQLWEHTPFRLEELEIEEKISYYLDGYQIRNIPIMLMDYAPEDAYDELVINLDTEGRITKVNKPVSKYIFNKIMSAGDVEDETREKIILSYVEDFRTAYDKKDLVFLNDVFSDNALIITGKVINKGKNERGIRLKPEIKYDTMGKSKYLERLAKVFKNTKYIKVDFNEIEVKKHPTEKDIFGVRLKQDYRSLYTSGQAYDDEGYLYLIWDFSNEDHPQILVRTWQPYWLDNNTKEQHIEEKDLIGLGSFSY